MTNPLRLIFCGTPQFAVPTLKALVVAGYEITLVVSQPDRPVGRDRQLTAPPVKLDENNNPIPAKTPEQAHGLPVAAALKLPVNRILAKATDADRLVLVPLLEAAECAVHQNGEHAKLTAKLLEIQNRR